MKRQISDVPGVIHFFTCGVNQVPFRIEGGVSLGQYIRIIRMN
jgi:hypothetical protein